MPDFLTSLSIPRPMRSYLRKFARNCEICLRSFSAFISRKIRNTGKTQSDRSSTICDCVGMNRLWTNASLMTHAVLLLCPGVVSGPENLIIALPFAESGLETCLLVSKNQPAFKKSNILPSLGLEDGVRKEKSPGPPLFHPCEASKDFLH
jgi:hypothetical protein